MRGSCLKGNLGAIPRIKWKFILRGKRIDTPYSGGVGKARRDYVGSFYIEPSYITDQICSSN